MENFPILHSAQKNFFSIHNPITEREIFTPGQKWIFLSLCPELISQIRGLSRSQSRGATASRKHWDEDYNIVDSLDDSWLLPETESPQQPTDRTSCR